MADSFDVQCALEDAKGRVFTGLSRRVRPAHRDALLFTFEDGGEIEIPGSTPDFTIMAAAVFETDVRDGCGVDISIGREDCPCAVDEAAEPYG